MTERDPIPSGLPLEIMLMSIARHKPIIGVVSGGQWYATCYYINSGLMFCGNHETPSDACDALISQINAALASND